MTRVTGVLSGRFERKIHDLRGKSMTGSNKKLVVTSATLVVTSACPCMATSNSGRSEKRSAFEPQVMSAFGPPSQTRGQRTPLETAPKERRDAKERRCRELRMKSLRSPLRR